MGQKERANELLAKVYGHHSYRPGQQELIEGLLGGRDVLGVMPTGSVGGKVILPSLGKDFFTSVGKQFFT